MIAVVLIQGSAKVSLVPFKFYLDSKNEILFSYKRAGSKLKDRCNSTIETEHFPFASCKKANCDIFQPK